MIKYVKGDLLDAPQKIVVHQVNCQGVMGSGVAKALRDKYPQVYTNYKAFIDAQIKDNFFYPDFTNKDLLGMIQFVKVGEDRFVCNLFGQNNYLPRTKRHTDYSALHVGFNDLRSATPEDIAMPKIGCGLGGGDWKLVVPIIESVFNDRDIYVYEL